MALGSRPLAALAAARLADVLCKQRQLAPAEQALAAAELLAAGLDDRDGGSSSSTGGWCTPLGYCLATVQLVRAQLSAATAPAGGGGGAAARKAAWLACQAAAERCEQLAGSAPDSCSCWCRALHAEALLTAAEAALVLRDDRETALRFATAAAAGASAAACSGQRCQHAAALLFLGRHAESPQDGAAGQQQQQQQLAVWGLCPSPAGGAAWEPADVAEGAKGGGARSRKAAAAAKPVVAVGRGGRGKAATAAAAEDGGLPMSPSERQLWQALALSRGLLATHR